MRAVLVLLAMLFVQGLLEGYASRIGDALAVRTLTEIQRRAVRRRERARRATRKSRAKKKGKRRG